MTRKEAAKILKGIEEVQGDLPEDGELVEVALRMAIQALKIVDSLELLTEMYKQRGNNPTKAISMEDLKEMLK